MKRNRTINALLLILSLFVLQGLSASQAAELPNFTRLVKINSPAIVNISTTQEINTADSAGKSGDNNATPAPHLPNENPFNQFFKHFFGNRPHFSGKEKIQSLGSGFIISSDGYILTNNHVVKNADKIMVQLSNHREFHAKLIGSDERTDVALLKINANGLPTVKIGDSAKLQVGQWVLAIGSPFGLQYTATQGIVSALGRSLPDDTYVPFIQTDAAINPGNSGGPLFNLQGQVIGINSQIYSNTGGYMGLSFAIPINVAMNVAKQIKAHGYVVRGWLGVYIQPVTPNLAESFGMKRAIGALVSKVISGSPAAKAGVKSGDIILMFDGKNVDEADHLPPMVAATPIGKTVSVIVRRDGKKLELRVTIKRLQGQKFHNANNPSNIARLKMRVIDLSKTLREKLKLGNRGVLVKEIESGPAANAGIRPGDIILSMNYHDISNTNVLRSVVRKLPRNKAVPVLIQRGNGTLFLALKIVSH